MACFFVFDKEASAELNNNIGLANAYATQLATLASRYTAHANIRITNAGVELWTNQDRIPFTVGTDVYSAMPNFVTQFQTYLNNTQASLFGKTYAVGVLLSNKTIVQGGYSQGPPCTTAGQLFFSRRTQSISKNSFLGTSLINFRPVPWQIAGLLAHELAHTLSVVHPFELSYLCQSFPGLDFCRTPNSIPAECLCQSNEFPAQQCLMTFAFGRANAAAPRYTSCDIQMMNYFSSNLPCLIKVRLFMEQFFFNSSSSFSKIHSLKNKTCPEFFVFILVWCYFIHHLFNKRFI